MGNMVILAVGNTLILKIGLTNQFLAVLQNLHIIYA